MTPFQVHTLDSAPAASRPVLEATNRAWGFIPTLHATLAEAPAALEAYSTLFSLIGQSSLSAQEQQVAYLAVSVFHECEYCVAGHTFLARSVALPEDVIAALRGSQPIAGHPRLQVLREFTERVLRERGFAGDDAVDTFVASGFTRAQVLELVTLIACKTISNYTNHLAHTPKESFMADPNLGWVAPGRRAG